VTYYVVIRGAGAPERVECPTADDARKTAERIVRDRATPRGTVSCSIQDGPLSQDLIAAVRMDAYGRVWTDVMPDGTPLL
jgi:hypothetical protein